MINKLNKSIDLKVLEDRLAEELEDRIEFGCYIGNVDTTCSCNINVKACAVDINMDGIEEDWPTYNFDLYK